MISNLERLLNESPLSALWFVLWVGAVVSLSSCMVLRLPVVVGYILGSKDSKRHGLLLTGLFALGLVVSCLLIGATVAFAGGLAQKTLHISRYLHWSLGALLLAAGLLMSGLVGPRWLPKRWRHLSERLARADLVGALALGAGFGLVVMPACPSCGGGLIAIGGMVASKGLALHGLALFISFGLGQALPILAVGALTSLVRPELVKKMRTRMCSVERHIQLLAGNVLVVAGIYFIVVG